MEDQVKSLSELFQNRIFRVPDYQRGYAWEEEHWNDLMEDLECLPAGKEHFTGTLILHDQQKPETDKNLERHHVFHVVDGQQRLTTLVILTLVIAELLAEDQPELTKTIRATYGQGIDQYDAPFPKLRLNPDCDDYFQREIVTRAGHPGGPEIQSHHRLYDAREFFRRRLSALEVPAMRQLYCKATQDLKFLRYEVKDAADVGVIFEVTNDRGKPLSELEKVKNYLLYLCSKLEVPSVELADRINKVWARIFEKLMSARLPSHEDENRFLRATWLMAYHHEPKKWKGCKSVKEAFSLRVHMGQHIELRDRISEYLDRLEGALPGFCDVYRPGHSDAFGGFPETQKQDAKHWGMKVCRLGNVAPYLPMLMAVRIRFPDDGSCYTKLLQLCEKAAFRVHRWAEKRSNAGQSTYFRLGNELFHKAIEVADLIDCFTRTILWYCPNKLFKENTEFDGESWYRWSGLKYFLYEYEESLADAERKPVEIAWIDVIKKDLEETIEHILPQNPTDEYWTNHFSEADRGELTHDIGNLVLTYDNSSLSNKSFPDKQGSATAPHRCYAKSKLFSEHALVHYEDWNRDAVMDRRQVMMDWAMTRWHLDEPDSPAAELEQRELETDDSDEQES